MWEAFKPFDAYTLNARIYPALTAGLPTMALPFVAVRWDQFGLSNVFILTASSILLYGLSNVARRRGLKVEERLGTRATPYLWYQSDPAISNVSKERYKAFIASEL